MALDSLDILKKGLKTLSEQVKARKVKLEAQLAEGNPISPEEEQWLDWEANLVDEERVLDSLEKASDYERAFESLDEGQKGTVKRLQQAAGAAKGIPGKKRKRVYFQFPFPYSCD
jgi:hypothetical protein